MAFKWLPSELADWLVAQQLTTNRIERKLDKLMAVVKVQSEDLDALDTALDEATQAISDKIAALDLPPADLTALNEDLAALRAIGAPAPVEDPNA